jgi:hypothetical protein
VATHASEARRSLPKRSPHSDNRRASMWFRPVDEEMFNQPRKYFNTTTKITEYFVTET